MQDHRAQEFVPASQFASYEGITSIDLIQQMKELGISDRPPTSPMVNGSANHDDSSKGGSPTEQGRGLSPSQYTGTSPVANQSPNAHAEQLGQFREEGLEGTEGHEDLYTASHGAAPDAVPGHTPANEAGQFPGCTGSLKPCLVT